MILLPGCASDQLWVATGPDGSVVPIDGPAPAGVPQGTVLAAVVNRTSGGIAAFESGVSAVILFSDGNVLRLQGMPWGPPGRAGSCATEIQEALTVARRSLGTNGTIDCRADMVADATIGRMGPEALAAIRVHLDGLAPVTVPASRQQGGCCDRVFATRYLWLEGAETFVMDEQQTGPPTAVGTTADAVMAELAALGGWCNGA